MARIIELLIVTIQITRFRLNIIPIVDLRKDIGLYDGLRFILQKDSITIKNTIRMVQEIIDAAIQPLTKTSTWYGVWFALALRKEIMRLVHASVAKIKERYLGQDEEK